MENKKREDIISSARELFTLYGFKKVSMEEIAKNANVSKVTIYSYFKDKEDLLNLFVKEELLSMKKMINYNLKENKSFFDELNKALINLFKYKKNQKILIKLAQEVEYSNNLKIKKSLRDIDEKITIYIKEWLDESIKNNQIRKCNTSLIAQILFSCYTSLIIKYDEKNINLSDYEISETVVGLLKNGLKVGDE